MSLRLRTDWPKLLPMTTGIDTFRDVVALWQSKEAMAADVAVKPSAVSKWWQRDSIPAEYWASILRTDVAVRSDLTSDVLIELAAREPAEVRA